MKNICIIPARGGSKRIPRKNVKDFLGKPIIAYSIEAALQSKLFDEVMVSTDDEEIAGVARKYGASVPFMRSAATADDHATTADVLNEVILKYADRGRSFDACCCLYATAPFVTPQRLQEAHAKLDASDCIGTFTVVPYSYPVQRSIRIDSDGSSYMSCPEYKSARSQDLETIYHDAGQFYFTMIQDFKPISVMDNRTGG